MYHICTSLKFYLYQTQNLFRTPLLLFTVIYNPICELVFNLNYLVNSFIAYTNSKSNYKEDCMRRANGSGSITKLSGKRRNSFRARVTLGYELNEETGRCKAVTKVIGDYPTRDAAVIALTEYRNCPYDLDGKSMTFKQLYEVWSAEYFTTLKRESSQRTVISSYSYCSSLYNMKIRDIKVPHLQDCMKNAYIIETRLKNRGDKKYATAHIRCRMKSLFNLMFDYAVRYEYLVKNVARTFSIDNGTLSEQKRNTRIKVPFTISEIDALWECVDYMKNVDMILIGIYTGFRPQELAILEVENVNLEGHFLKGGLKTDAGIDRYVPIAEDIVPLIEKRLAEAKRLGSERLFNDEESQTGMYLTYDKYRKRFEKVMKRLGFSHTPHETRHTFISIAKDCDFDDNVLKLIVGHSIGDITERVYTHRTVKCLLLAIAKFDYHKLNEDERLVIML